MGTFGSYIKEELVKNEKIKQAIKLAEILRPKISYNYFSKVLNGRETASNQLLNSIAFALNIKPSILEKLRQSDINRKAFAKRVMFPLFQTIDNFYSSYKDANNEAKETVSLFLSAITDGKFDETRFKSNQPTTLKPHMIFSFDNAGEQGDNNKFKYFYSLIVSENMYIDDSAYKQLDLLINNIVTVFTKDAKEYSFIWFKDSHVGKILKKYLQYNDKILNDLTDDNKDIY